MNGSHLVIVQQLAHLVAWSPWVMLMAAAGFVCLLRLSTRPREGWLVGLAIVVLLFARFGIPNIVNMLLIRLLGPTTPDRVWMLILMGEVPASIAHVVAWGLVLYAAFGEEAVPRSKYLVEDDL